MSKRLDKNSEAFKNAVKKYVNDMSDKELHDLKIKSSIKASENIANCK